MAMDLFQLSEVQGRRCAHRSTSVIGENSQAPDRSRGAAFSAMIENRSGPTAWNGRSGGIRTHDP